MVREKTEQELFWQGEFGDDYIERNGGAEVLASKITAFTHYLGRAKGIKTSLELGGNIGMNEMALRLIIPGIKMETVEINSKAAQECRKIPDVTVYNQSIYDFVSDKKYDLTFTNGVLIHLAPEMLDAAYDILYKYSKRYILISEYYNPTPVEVPYRGNAGKMYKRDFAGEMMDKYLDLSIADYGFIYHRALSHPVADDLNWFLLEKE